MIQVYSQQRLIWRAVLFCCAMEVAGMASAGSPYASISQRNLFRLRPPGVARVEAPHEPLPKVHLTGITTILRGKRALFKVEFPAKGLQKPKEESYILREGQKAGPIEVLQIDEKKAEVKVNNSGTITTVTFEKTGPPAAAPTRPAQQIPGLRVLPYRRYRG